MNRYLKKIAESQTFDLDSNKPVKGALIGSFFAPGLGTLGGYYWGKGREKDNMEKARKYLSGISSEDTSKLSRKELLERVQAAHSKQAGLLELAQKLTSGVKGFAESEGFKNRVNQALTGAKELGNQAKQVGDSALGAPTSRKPQGYRQLIKRDRVALGTGAAVGAAGLATGQKVFGKPNDKQVS